MRGGWTVVFFSFITFHTPPRSSEIREYNFGNALGLGKCYPGNNFDTSKDSKERMGKFTNVREY